jgi:hypothetical protein
MKLITALVLSVTALTAHAGDPAECNRIWKNNPNDPTGQFFKLCMKPSARIGMTKEQVINDTEWGKPEKINATTTVNGTSEQWRYFGGGYLYFVNGKLTAIRS